MSVSTNEQPSRPWWGEFLCAGTSAVMAICFTNPIDVVKCARARRTARVRDEG